MRRNLRSNVRRKRFSGTAYIAGSAYTGLNSDPDKPYVRIILGESVIAEENAGPMPSPFPANEEWYVKRYTYGDIHVARFG